MEGGGPLPPAGAVPPPQVLSQQENGGVGEGWGGRMIGLDLVVWGGEMRASCGEANQHTSTNLTNKG